MPSFSCHAFFLISCLLSHIMPPFSYHASFLISCLLSHFMPPFSYHAFFLIPCLLSHIMPSFSCHAFCFLAAALFPFPSLHTATHPSLPQKAMSETPGEDVSLHPTQPHPTPPHHSPPHPTVPYQAKVAYPQLGGLLSRSKLFNPVFHAWNLVWVVYCDGGAYSSTRGRADLGEGASVYMQGQAILAAIFRDLRRQRGMGAASHVLFSGSSAGGHAIIMHCDRLAAAFPRAQATCLVDSGFFVDAKDRFKRHYWREKIQALTALHRINVPNCPAGESNAPGDSPGETGTSCAAPLVALPCPACRAALLAARCPVLPIAPPSPAYRVALLAAASPCPARVPPCWPPPCCAQPCWPPPCSRAALLPARRPAARAPP
ncbi:unnamed protein product [Closterium sp. NIES-54]